MTYAVHQSEQHEADEYLTFFAEEFDCENGCGLKLIGVDELECAGLEWVYDRGSEYEQWMKEDYANYYF